MAYIKIEVDPVILEVATWAVFQLPEGKTVPRLYRIKDGSAKVFFSKTNSFWVPMNEVQGLEQLDDTPAISQPAPNPQISELTLLRAIALAQDPSLIRTMQ